MADTKWIKEYDRQCKEIVEAKLTMYTGFKPFPVSRQSTAATTPKQERRS